MISRETANTLLEEFSRQQEIEPLQLDDANYCALASADDHVVHLRFDEGQGTFIAFGSIGTLSADKLDAFLQSFALSLDFWTQRCATLGDTVMESEQPFYVKV